MKFYEARVFQPEGMESTNALKWNKLAMSKEKRDRRCFETLVNGRMLEGDVGDGGSSHIL